MGTLFTLTPGILSTTQTALDDLITELGKDCLLVYPPVLEPCTVCAGAETHGPHDGPAPANWSSCAACDGTGARKVETTETVKMLIATSPANWFYRPRPYTQVPANAEVPGGVLQSKCLLSLRPKLLKAQKMVLQPELRPAVNWVYELDGDVIDQSNIIKGRYCVAVWRRVR